MFISIHALRGEGDSNNPIMDKPATISIHALRGEGDLFARLYLSICIFISIHALRGEGDIEKIKSFFNFT